MAEKETITGLYKKNANSFLKNISSAKNLGEENIHNMRVDIKHLRSLLSFLEFLTGGKYQKKYLTKLMSPVFKSAGRHRVLSLNIKLMRNYRSKAASIFIEALKKKLTIAAKDLQKQLKNFDEKGFKKHSKAALKQFRKSQENSIKKHSRQFVMNMFSDIRVYMSELNEDANFHNIRKDLKNIKTIDQLMQKIISEKSLGTQLEKIKGVEEKIGKWHDNAILAEEIEKYINKQHVIKYSATGQKSKNLEKLALLVTKIKARNERDKIIIAKKLKKLLV